ncbi:NAAT family transporter [Dysgonomonas sp. Marseille-P4677]|uniref:MarC family protein n=1 Tax=Dysgonomonas sp. Marseille-P4677 TaxID=2364790 RepID=UPI00191385BD|nr:MarC family protein [Dysgonomonas sp. Marseille-P4677]MBK5721590.1 NAAT family transporter [Dysgonomonas sp. Marseille-P4677]
MNELFTYGLLVFTSFFTLINPISAMPVFLGLTSDMEPVDRVAVAKRSVIVTFIILLIFAFSGQFLFRVFGISVNSFRIVGGAIFFVVGFDMLNARLSPIKAKSSEIKQTIKDIAVTPLAIPMLCGPGAITNAIVLMEDANTILLKVVFVTALLSMLLVTYLVLISSSKLIKRFGETGINIMMRLMGLIIMVIAVEFFLAGIRPFLESLLS